MEIYPNFLYNYYNNKINNGKIMLILFLDLIDSPDDKDRFTYIYNKYNSYLYHYILMIVRDSHIAEDALQDVFFRVAKNIHKINFSDEIRLKKYLKVIAYNRALTYSKKLTERTKHERAFDENLDSNLDDSQESTNLENIIEKVSMERAVSAIRSLNSEYRDILILRYVYDKRQREIAELFNTTPEAIRKKIMRAEKKLFKLLSKEDFDID